MQDKMNNEEAMRQPILNLLHLQRGKSNALDSEQAEDPRDSLEKVRFSTSPRSSSSIGANAVRKRSWGRQASIRRSFQAMVHAQVPVPGAFKADLCRYH
jgi:hypothetical protein